MGDPSGAGGASERPAHDVTIAEPFAICVAPITFDDYQRFTDSSQRPLPDDEGWGTATRPVINVSWLHALEYSAWLAQETGLRYRLASEAEWEYAARAGASTHYWWGDRVGVGHASCDGCGSDWDNAQTSPVGSFPANAFGLVDMLGNVWEWVEDAWYPSHTGAPIDGSARHGGNENLRVARGGAWNYEPRHVRCPSRVGYTLGHRSSNVGFRVVLEL
jgi:formylglycine-generating enzyme required for sulfatase activity